MEASSPGEGLSQTPAGLGGIWEEERKQEPPVAPTTCLSQCIFQMDTNRPRMVDECFVFSALQLHCHSSVERWMLLTAK